MTTRRYFGAQLHSEDLLRRKGDLAIDKMGGGPSRVPPSAPDARPRLSRRGISFGRSLL